MTVVVLSTGHAFAEGSVICVSPAQVSHYSMISVIYDEFEVVGVGFSVTVKVSTRACPKEELPSISPATEIIRQEFIDKLLA